MCTRQSFLQAAVSSISRVQFTIERGRTETRGQLNNDQRLPIIDKNSFIKAQKSSIIFKVFGTQRFLLQDLKQNSYFSCTSFARPKYLNGFRRQKKFTMKARAEFYLFPLKFMLGITNRERFNTDPFVVFSVRLRVPSAFVQPAD